MRMTILLGVLAALLMGGCTKRTAYGECIGAFDEKDPHLKYRVSAWNIAMGVLFLEMVVPPIIVVVSEVQCPVDGVNIH